MSLPEASAPRDNQSFRSRFIEGDTDVDTLGRLGIVSGAFVAAASLAVEFASPEAPGEVGIVLGIGSTIVGAMIALPERFSHKSK